KIVTQPKCLRYPPPVMRQNSGRGIDGERDDLFGTRARDLLDIHAASGRNHESNPRAFAIDERGEIELALDARALLDIESMNLLAMRAGLMRDQHGAEQPLGLLANLLFRLHQLDAASLAAAAGMDLCLDDEHRRGEIVRSLDCLFDGERGLPARHRHT